jgi:hypothetical protein
MTEVVNRDELERKLARAIGKHQRAELDKLLTLLGNPPRLENVPAAYWENGWRNMAQQVEPILVEVYLDQAAAMLATIPIGVSWDMVNRGASEYARQYGFNLVKEIAENTRKGVEELIRNLQTEIPNFYEEGLNLGQLEERLSRWFSPIRAEMIAITETTRAATEGEREIVNLIEQETGRTMRPFWQTSDDERVCPDCGPRHDKEIIDDIYPPLHPRCRCWVVHEFPKGRK